MKIELVQKYKINRLTSQRNKLQLLHQIYGGPEIFLQNLFKSKIQNFPYMI